MPHLRLGSRRMAGERAALEMLRQPRAPQVLPEDRDYLRGFPPWLGQVACRRVADLQLKNGISSYEIGRDLGISQKSAWHMMHRLRFAFHHGNFNKLSGQIEADETFIGGKARNMHVAKRAKKITGTGGK